MKTHLLALAALATVAFGTHAQAEDSTTSTYERSCYGDRCTTTTSSPDSYSVRVCDHGGGGNVKCTTSSRDKENPEPTVENVHVGGKTINILRGLPR